MFSRPIVLLMLTLCVVSDVGVKLKACAAVAPLAKSRVASAKVPVPHDRVTVAAADSGPPVGVTVPLTALLVAPLLADRAMVKALA